MPFTRSQLRNPLWSAAVFAGLLFVALLARPVAAATKAPGFALPSAADNATIKMDDFQGKVVLVNFFATWCPPCRREIPSLDSLYKKFGPKGFAVIGISVDQNNARGVAKFVDRMAISYPVALADDHVTRDFGGIFGIPVSFLVDQQGNIVQRHDGYVGHDVLTREITSLLQ